MQIRLPVQAKLFLSHVLIVLLVAGTIGLYFFMSASESLMQGLQERLQTSAALISQTLDANELRHIRESSDTARPEYLANLEKLRTLRRMNSDIAFLYVMRQEGEKTFFVLDSDETAEQALPGKEYVHALPGMTKGFTATVVDEKINTDEWGSFLSGYAPIRNGMGQYLVGVDMRADKINEKHRNLRISALVSLLAAVAFAFVLARILANRFMLPIRLSINGCSSIAAGRLHETIEVCTNDEFDQLIDAFNTLSCTLACAEQKTQESFAALRQAKDELDIRVRQRTSDLSEVNHKLSQEIAERLFAQKALQEAATVDPLTRLFNRRAMQERLEQELARNRRNQKAFVVGMVDLDHFKRVNDTEGHDAGDSILVETGVRMKSMLRAQDCVARWGGEEFMILLPETSLEGGKTVAEKIRRRIAGTAYYFGGKEILVTASFGVAEFDGDLGLERLIKAADEALYRAKNLGRNRVELSEVRNEEDLS